MLPTLFLKTGSIDLNCRHGAVMAIGQIVHALSILNYKLSSALLDDIKNLILKYTKQMYFRGLGGELMKQACSDFIEKCSLSKLPFHNDPVIGNWKHLNQSGD